LAYDSSLGGIAGPFFIGSMNRSLAGGKVLNNWLFTMRSPDAVMLLWGFYEQMSAHAI
jgi:hypothetical protein